MKRGLFKSVSVNEGNEKWQMGISRVKPIYQREDEIRSEFARDYTRILHCTAYRRLKHKTQVFFATRNDHVCTRIEHVNHVASVSYTIADYLGLNTELTNAIATGHDLGHAPFGHAGEEYLKEIVKKELGETFWHERNSLRFVDKCETLPDSEGNEYNLNLTYAVRDGIVCHCGEVDENAIFPRNDALDLYTIEKSNQCSPYTWEGCVVKIADKISYLGRDIEDARLLKVLNISETKELIRLGRKMGNTRINEINTTLLMHDFIVDLCRNSSPTNGISFSPKYLEFINALKDYNYLHIYKHWRLNRYRQYAKLVVESVYQTLYDGYNGGNTIDKLNRYKEIYPILINTFCDWLYKYSNVGRETKKISKYQNDILYNLEEKNDYIQAIVDFISGMSDSFAIKIYNEITTF